MAESLQAPPLPGTGAPLPRAQQPIRPSWNPVEEARRHAEQQRVALEQYEAKNNKRGKLLQPPPPVDMSLTAQIAVINAERPNREHATPGGFHATVVPRTVCVTGFFLAFSMPAVFLLLNHFGHADLVDGHFKPDETARRMLVILLGGALLCQLTGWLWWGVAAALNARHRARWAVSPLYVPATYFGVGAAAILAAFSDRWLGEKAVYVRACALAFGVIMYFGTLSTYRRTAQSVGAPTKYFTRLIVVPWVMFIGGTLFVIVSRFLAPQAMIGFVIGLMLVHGLYGLTMYQAMLSMDRASAGTRMMHQDDQEFAKFLKLAR